jgi:hypothetical protein
MKFQAWVDMKTLCRSAVVSKLWRRFAYHSSSLGLRLDFRPFRNRFSNEDLVHLLSANRITSKVVEVDLSLSKGVRRDQVALLLKRCPGLTSLSLSRNVSEEPLENVLSVSSKLVLSFLCCLRYVCMCFYGYTIANSLVWGVMGVLEPKFRCCFDVNTETISERATKIVKAFPCIKLWDMIVSIMKQLI